MKLNYPALVIYVVASAITIISMIIGCDSLTFFVKPIIVPAIFFYYLQRNKYVVNWLFFLAVASSYASDMIVLLEHKNDQVVITLLNMITYLVMLYYVVHDLSIKKIGVQKAVYFVANLLSFLGIVYIMLSLMTEMNSVSLTMYVVYGFIISLLASLAIINQITTHNLKTFYGLVMCICFVTTDVFYVVYNFYMNMIVFLMLNLSAQFISYFYMVKYVTASKKQVN